MEQQSWTLTSQFAGMPIWAWIAVGVAVIVLIIMLIALASVSKKRSQWDKAFYYRLADARWFTDSLTLSIADRTKSTPELVRNWTDGSPRMATLSQQLYELSSNAPTANRVQQTRAVATAVDRLREALDADVRMRTQGYAPGQDAMIAESAVIVAQRRRELDGVLRAYRH